MSSSRVPRLLFACMFALVIFTLTGNAQTFSSKDYPATMPAAGPLARADLNHDGFADIINAGGRDVLVLLNNGDGTFRAPVPYSANGDIIKIKTADVNGDHNPDVVISVLDTDGTGHIEILYGNGDGTLSNLAPLSRSFPNFHGFDLADFNGDGKADLVVIYNATTTEKDMTVYYGSSAGFANPREFDHIGQNAQPGENDYFLVAVAAGDFNGDGHPDIAIGEGGGGFDVPSGSYSVFDGKGDGTFGNEMFIGGASGIYNIQTVNANNDGIDDLAVFFSGCHTPCHEIRLVYGTSTGLGAVSSSVVPPFDGVDAGNPHAIVFADVNGDGRPDVIAAGTEVHENGSAIVAISVNIQQSDGSFKRISLIERPGIGLDELLVGDFNNDGKWDFVSSNDSSGTVSVFTNTTSGIGCAYPSTNRSLSPCVGGDGKTSPILFRANARSTNEITGLRIYVDGVSKFLTHDSPLTARVIITPGTHKVTVKAWDATGPFSSTFSLTVFRDSGACQPALTARSVTICTPNPNEWQPTTVHLTANANGKNVSATQVYVDGTLKYQTPNFAVDTQLSLTEGKRRITVKGWDDSGAFSTTIIVWVYGGSCKPSVAPGGRGLTVCNPKAGVTYNGSVPIQAIAVSPNPITSFTVQWENSQPQSFPQGWVDEVSVGPPGNNTWKFVAKDSQGTMSSVVTVLVANDHCPAPSTRTVAICSPNNGETVNGVFSLQATAGKPSGTFKALQIYHDGLLWYTTDTQFFSIATSLPAGQHRITAKGWDSTGAYSTTINITSTGN